MAEAYPSPNIPEEQGQFARERVREPQGQEPSFADLIGGLVGDAQTLVRKEIDLAKEEVRAEVDKAKQGAVALGIGIGVLLPGVLLLAHFLALAIADLFDLSAWVGYLIIGGLLAVIGGVMLYSGMKRVQQLDPLPRETIDSVRKDVEWIQGQSPSDRT